MMVAALDALTVMDTMARVIPTAATTNTYNTQCIIVGKKNQKTLMRGMNTSERTSCWQGKGILSCVFGDLRANKRWWRWGWRWVWSLPWLKETSTSGKWRRPHSAQAVKCPRTAPWGDSMEVFSFVPISIVLEPFHSLFKGDATWNRRCPRKGLAGTGEVWWCWTGGLVATLGVPMCSPVGKVKYCHCMT